MTGHASVIGSQPFLRKLPAEYVDRLAVSSRHVSFPAGYRLFHEDSPARNFWLIDAGQLALDALVPGVGQVTIEKLGRGDVVGLSWLEPPYQFRYGGITTQPLQAYEFDAAAVRAACAEDPAFGYAVLSRFVAIASHRLGITRNRLIEARARAAA